MIMVTYTTVSKVDALIGESTSASSSPSTSEVEIFIERAEAEIDDLTGTTYTSNTSTDELHDYDRYSVFLKEPQLVQVGRVDRFFNPVKNVFKVDNKPIISVTSLEVNQGSVESSDWKSLTENEDFIVYNTEGSIVFIKSGALPVENFQSIKITYTYGHSSVPLVVERLCTLMAAKEIIRSKQLNSSYNSIDDISIETISISKSTRESVELLTNLQDEIDRLQEKIVGTINYEIL